MEFADGYEGVTVAGLAIVRHDGGSSVFLAQRAPDETDAPDVAETWEFPGGHLSPGEEPFAAATREFEEEIGFPLPPGEITGGWRSEDGHYQCFVYEPVEFPALTDWQPTDEVQAVGWFTPENIDDMESGDSILGTLRPEVMKTDWSQVWGPVSGNEGTMTEQTTEPGWDSVDLALYPIPVHGVVAPEDVPTGDGRGFNGGSMTRRPLRLPFSDQKIAIGGHDGSVVVGSVDRLMRKDGLIHWEGALMPSPETDDLVSRMEFFDGRYGVSVDGDQGSLDKQKSTQTGVMWFDAVRASGLTSVAIPAFHEAYVAFGTHPLMPENDTEAVLAASGIGEDDIIGGRVEFKRGPGWVTNPKETNRIHDYWTKPGQEGYQKVAWGTPGDFARAKALIGKEIAKHSPDKMRFLNQIIAQWHFDALGYWPATHAKMDRGDKSSKHTLDAGHTFSVQALAEDDPLRGDAYCAAGCGEPAEYTVSTSDEVWFALYCTTHAAEYEDKAIPGWEDVMAASGRSRALPPMSYFDRHPDTGATVIEEPDEFGLRRTYGYAAEWGVCHIGYSGRCVEPPRTYSDEYPEFHLGRTKTVDGYLNTGVLTYKVEHRDAETILTETAEQSHFDNIAHAWAAVRVGEDDRGIWFSGVVLPGVPDDDCVLIEAAGQVSGEWKYGKMRACQAVNVPGYPVMRSSAAFDDDGNVVALVAVTAGDRALVASLNGTGGSECDEESPRARMQALAKIDAETRMDALRAAWAVR